MLTSPNDRIYEQGCRINPVCHQFIEGPWIEAVRNATERDTLRLYYHRVSGRYVLADLVIDPEEHAGGGLMDELEMWDFHPDRFATDPFKKHRPNWGEPPPTIEYIRATLQMREDPLLECVRKMDAEEARESAMLEDSDRQSLDVARFYKNRANPRLQKVGDMLASGEHPYVGDMEGGELLAEMKEFLNDLV